MVEQAAGRHCLRGVDGILSNVDMLNDALFVDDERRTLSELVTGTADLLQTHGHPILPKHLEARVAQERELNVDLLGEGCIRCGTVTTDSENHRVARGQLGPINLIGFEFAGSSIGEGEHVEDEHDVLLPSKIAQLDLFPVVAQQSEIRRFLADAQDVGRWGISEGRGGNGQRHCPNEYAENAHR